MRQRVASRRTMQTLRLRVCAYLSMRCTLGASGLCWPYSVGCHHGRSARPRQQRAHRGRGSGVSCRWAGRIGRMCLALRVVVCVVRGVCARWRSGGCPHLQPTLAEYPFEQCGRGDDLSLSVLSNRHHPFGCSALSSPTVRALPPITGPTTFRAGQDHCAPYTKSAPSVWAQGWMAYSSGAAFGQPRVHVTHSIGATDNAQPSRRLWECHRLACLIGNQHCVDQMLHRIAPPPRGRA